MTMKLTVVLPTYNELKNIQILIPELEGYLNDKKIAAEIIIVDDQSPDGTAQAAEKLNKQYDNIRVIVKEKKEGIGAALRIGYTAARGELILSMDSDLSFEITDIEKFIAKIYEGYDLVVGSRHIKEAGYEKKTFNTRVKWFVSKFGNKIVRAITGVPIHDFSANFRMIRRSVWNTIETRENTNSLLLEMILKTKYKGLKVTEIPVTFKDRIYGESKLNLKKEAPKFFVKLFYFTIKYRLLKQN